MLDFLTRAKKSVINVLTIIVAVTPYILKVNGLLPTNIAAILSTVLSIAGIIYHYLAANTTTNPAVAASQSVKLKTAA